MTRATWANRPGSNLPNVQNVIAQSVQGEGPGPLPASQVITGTSETLLTNPANTALALSCAIPPNALYEQIPFDFNWSGVITTTESANITLKVYEGTAIVSGNLLGSSGAEAYPTSGGSAPFWAAAKLMFDSVSGKLDGKIEFFLNHVLVSAVAVSHTITGISNTTDDPVVQFCVSVTASAASGSDPVTVNTQDLSVG
jgi:hypothetical protein